MSFNTAPRVTENLFLNTLKFEFPTEPVTFYFSDTDLADAHFTYLKSSTLFLIGLLIGGATKGMNADLRLLLVGCFLVVLPPFRPFRSRFGVD